MSKQSAIEFVKRYGEKEMRNIANHGTEPERSMAITILRIAEVEI
jgi:hypothetical protein